jgi:hypothetical protein
MPTYPHDRVSNGLGSHGEVMGFAEALNPSYALRAIAAKAELALRRQDFGS